LDRNAEEVAKVQRAVQRVLDLQEIQNLMSKHLYYYATGQRQRDLDELWAMTTQGVSWGSDEGYWVDARELKEYYVHYFDTVHSRELAAFSKTHPEVKNAENYGVGASILQANSSPIIQIAEDGYTAQGLWYPVVQVTQGPGGKQTSAEGWEAYGVDFYKPNEEWKIWHFFVHRDGSPPRTQLPVPVPGAKAAESSDAPPPSVLPALDGKVKKSPYASAAGFLKVPKPYRAFSLTFSYGPPDNR